MMKNLIELKSVDSCIYDESFFKDKNLQKMVKRRNEKLLELFVRFAKKYNSRDDVIVLGEYIVEKIEKIRLIRSPHQPKVIINDTFAFSMYVNNFNLIFTDSFKDGEDYKSIIIPDDKRLATWDFEGEYAKILQVFVDYEVETSKIFKIVLLNNSNNLDIIKYYYSKTEKTVDYFSTDNPRLFYSATKADRMRESIINRRTKDDYILIIV